MIKGTVDNPEKVSGRDLSWKDNELYYRNKKTGFSVFKWPNEGYVHYKIKFENGDISEDFYNLTRAKDNAIKAFRQNAPEIA